MGQYYKPLLIADDGTMQTASAHDYDNGIKLMEHSWVGNNFINAVLYNLDNNPQRVAWIGDYADSVDNCCFSDGFINDRIELLRFYDLAWRNSSKVSKIDKSLPEYKLSNNEADCFIINLTRNCYIDMEKYVTTNIKQGWCVNPLPLLTSIGNGQGGGDYRGNDPKGDVGSWAFDKIYISALKPQGMKEVMYHFFE